MQPNGPSSGSWGRAVLVAPSVTLAGSSARNEAWAPLHSRRLGPAKSGKVSAARRTVG